MFTIDENRAISRYLDSGGGHFGFSHDKGVPDFFLAWHYILSHLVLS